MCQHQKTHLDQELSATSCDNRRKPTVDDGCPSTESLMTAATQIRLSAGSILWIKLDDPDFIEPVLTELANRIPEDVFIIVSPPGVELKDLSEEDMNANGWFRRPEAYGTDN